MEQSLSLQLNAFLHDKIPTLAFLFFTAVQRDSGNGPCLKCIFKRGHYFQGMRDFFFFFSRIPAYTLLKLFTLRSEGLGEDTNLTTNTKINKKKLEQ